MSYWKEKVVVVTGASSGLGRVIALESAAAGARVVLTARGEERLRTVVDEIEQRGGVACGIAADVTRDDSVAALFNETISKFGRIDALVNCAGRSQRRAILDTTPEDFQQLIDINLLSTVRCTRAAAEHLIASRGHVVNIGSLAGKLAARYIGAYPAAKFAVSAYSQQLRLELGPRGLHVLLVCPGPIARDPSDAATSELTRPDRDREEDFAGLPESARKPGAGAKTSPLDPHQLARHILRACQQRKPELVAPAKARLLIALAYASPRLGDYLIRKLT